MALYDALTTKWATLTGTTAEKLAAINALTIPGPAQSVPISAISAYLKSEGVWLPIKAAAATNSAAAATVDLESDLRITTLDLDLPLVTTLLAALVTSNLLTQAQADALVAMKKTALPWWQATVAQNGGGYTSPVSDNDLIAAGGLS